MKTIIVGNDCFKSLSDILRTMGFTSIVKSTHCENVLALCNKKVDVVFLEAEYQDDDVFAIAKELKKLEKRPCIVLVVSNATKEVILNAKDVGIKSLLMRPYSRGTIVEALEKFSKPKKKKKS